MTEATRPWLAHLLERYPTARRDGDRARLVWRYTTATGDQVRIGIHVEPIRIENRRWLQLLAEIGPASRVEPLAALEHNYSLGVGGLTIAGELLVLRAVIPELATFDDLEQSLSLLAHEAAQWKHAVGTTVPASEVFELYAI